MSDFLTMDDNVIDKLYMAGYQDSLNERDHDPRGCEEWQAVVDLIEQQQARIAELEQERDEIAKEKDMEHYHRRAVDEENQQLKQERDALASTVERLKKSHDDVINAFNLGTDDDLQYAVGRMIDQLREHSDV